VNSFIECNDRYHDEMEEQNNEIKNFLNEGGLNFLAGMEAEFDCSGFCEVGRFYLAKDIEYGPPQQECIQGMIDGLAGKVGPAAYGLIGSGILLFIAMVGAFPLCSGY